MNTRNMIITRVALLLLVVPVLPAFAQDDVITEIQRLRPNELAISGFELSGDQTVSIEAVGIRSRSRRYDIKLSSAWILDSSTRKVVWEMGSAHSENMGEDLRRYDDDLRLSKGRYEVYYSSFPNYRGDNREVDGIGDFISNLFGDDFDYRDFRRAAKKFKIVIHGNGRELSEADILDYQKAKGDKALVSLISLENSVYEKYSMTLDKQAELEIYAVGEMRKDGNYDYSWIVDNKNREIVWRLDHRHSEPAGGASKNRTARETITLLAGEYSLFCVTDDSHNFDDWNAPPPHDPLFWGLTIRVKSGGPARIGEYRAVEDKNVVVQFTRLGESEFVSKGFTLKRPMKLRLYALGEGYGPDMADYSWIVDADTRETIWEFTYRHSDHAGGSSKNRIIDDVVELDKGDYIAYATTDDSHSFGDWNAAAPYDREHWGLTVTVTEGKVSDVSTYSEKEDKNVLAQIVRVGNDAHERETFSLSEPADVRVVAIGEGRRGAMHDYAWMETRAGKVVWEMTYRQTRHAGGAKKNRVFDDVIHLDAGKYVLYYESDGSHAFNRWNSKPPSDPWNWGVTVKLAGTR